MLASPFYLHTWKKFVDEGVLDSNRINEKNFRVMVSM